MNWQQLINYLLVVVRSWLSPVATAPVTPAPPATPGVPAPVPSQQELIAAAILKHNNALLIQPQAISDITGSYVAHIDAATAADEAAVLLKACAAHSFPGITFALSQIAVESGFDPLALNKNISYTNLLKTHVGSNPSNDPEYYDVGLCQFKIHTIKSFCGNDVAKATVWAYAPDQCVDYFVSLLKNIVADAESLILTFNTSDINPKFRNPYYTAAAIYNFGPTGGKQIIEDPKSYPNPNGTLFDADGTSPKHCTAVVVQEQIFAKALGVPSVFADITG